MEEEIGDEVKNETKNDELLLTPPVEQPTSPLPIQLVDITPSPSPTRTPIDSTNEMIEYPEVNDWCDLKQLILYIANTNKRTGSWCGYPTIHYVISKMLLAATDMLVDLAVAIKIPSPGPVKETFLKLINQFTSDCLDVVSVDMVDVSTKVNKLFPLPAASSNETSEKPAKKYGYFTQDLIKSIYTTPKDQHIHRTIEALIDKSNPSFSLGLQTLTCHVMATLTTIIYQKAWCSAHLVLVFYQLIVNTVNLIETQFRSNPVVTHVIFTNTLDVFIHFTDPRQHLEEQFMFEYEKKKTGHASKSITETLQNTTSRATRASLSELNTSSSSECHIQ